ncbi:MAG: hypothetical protein KZQ95_12855 [Candidatus Thiodiazotropha sp. (ex Epidulcina cf. delphinae)]|nr:hypothetical protein [Candidatus Thiodiazotropha sp. (ex Epidulcina cf. delphinae)]
MNGIELTAGDWINLLTHVKKWVSNLLRAGQARKEQSRDALRSVIRAVRETEIYVRHLNEGGEKSIDTERQLSFRWTDLSFALEDLALDGLAKRCRIKGQYWADPSRFDREFLDKAGTKLSEVERVTLLALKQIKG